MRNVYLRSLYRRRVRGRPGIAEHFLYWIADRFSAFDDVNDDAGAERELPKAHRLKRQRDHPTVTNISLSS